MRTDDKSLVYLLYGNSRAFHLELTYSVLSAVQQAPADRRFRIVLITDRQGRRDDLPVEHFFFTDKDFDRWTYGRTYMHAAKVNAMIAAIDRFGGKVAMVDTDTYFLADPSLLFDRIDAGTSVMHTLEGSLAGQGGYWDKIIDQSAMDPQTRPPITLQSPMYNSGVIGVHHSARNSLENALRLMQKLNSIDPRVHNVEQFALGQVLATSFKILGCEDLVRHYFGYARAFIHARLDKLFPHFTKQAFGDAPLVTPTIEEYPPKSKIDLLRAKVKRIRRRQPSIYGFAYLAYLSALHARDDAEANAWSTIAIDAIRWNHFPREIVAADFGRMRFNPQSKPKWMAPEIRSRWLEYWDGAP